MTVKIETFYAVTNDMYATSKILQKQINEFLLKNSITVKNAGDIRITPIGSGLHGLVIYEA